MKLSGLKDFVESVERDAERRAQHEALLALFDAQAALGVATLPTSTIVAIMRRRFNCRGLNERTVHAYRTAARVGAANRLKRRSDRKTTTTELYHGAMG
jgi:hypothetical protein